MVTMQEEAVGGWDSIKFCSALYYNPTKKWFKRGKKADANATNANLDTKRTEC